LLRRTPSLQKLRSTVRMPRKLQGILGSIRL
jgi:hypothetical protein